MAKTARTDKAKAETTQAAKTSDSALSVGRWLTLPRLLFWALIMVAVSLQARLWLGEGSLAEVWQLRKEIDKQQQENYVLSERNRRLSAEVKDLKQGLGAVEERARSQLGMVRTTKLSI